MYDWIVFIHVLAAFAFFMAHGASAVMAFRLRREQETARIRAILDLSSAAQPAMYISLLVLLIAGIIAGLMHNWFTQGWIWTALILIVVLWFGMSGYAARFYSPIRKAVGLPYRVGMSMKEHPAETPASDAEIVALAQTGNPTMLLVISFVLIAIILWLMMFKPF